MPTAILATKLYIPPLRPDHILRTRLHQRLSDGLHHKLTLISAPAGFGKTTLVSSWVENLQDDTQGDKGDNLLNEEQATLDPNATTSPQVAWLSLDAGDNDPYRFFAYVVAAIQTVAPAIGQDIVAVLQSPQPPPLESILTALINDIAATARPFILVLDDYHIIDAPPVDRALTYLIEHLPPQVHLLITTREDPSLPLARLRARGHLNELRAADLRFTTDEAADFLGEVTGFALSAEEINALENRTEGWIAGLQMAAISMQGHQDIGGFIDSFTGSHHFIMDYLVEEVIHQQSDDVQAFLLYTSILERFCGSLCDAVLQTDSGSGQKTLWAIAQANLFLVPLDNERRWYRYHHLFADLLQQRLRQHITLATDNKSGAPDIAELHRRASVWFEENALEIEAFQHAVAANDVDHAAFLAEGKGMPLLFRGAVSPILRWLESLPHAALDARPSLWVMYASALIYIGRTSQVEPTLQLAEAALRHVEETDKTRDDTGHIATIRATMAIPRLDVETILTQSQRALTYLHPDNLPVRTATTWVLGFAHQTMGDRIAAKSAYREAMTNSERLGHFIIHIASATGIGNMLEGDIELYSAAELYQKILQLAGRWPAPASSETQLGLARIFYQWNKLDLAKEHAQQSVHLAEQIEGFRTEVTATLLLARLRLAVGDVDGAKALVGKAEDFVQQEDAAYLLPEMASMQARILLHQGKVREAAKRIAPYDLPFLQAMIWLAQGESVAALTLLSSLHQKAVAKEWRDEQLLSAILLAIGHYTHGEVTTAIPFLKEALTLAEPNGIVRAFVDEGAPMAHLLQEAANLGVESDYVPKLLDAFAREDIGPATIDAGKAADMTTSTLTPAKLPIEPLSSREIEVLSLVAQGCSNREISEQLVVALDTVKGHNRRIFGKLQVQRRTEAVARARELGIIAR